MTFVHAAALPSSSSASFIYLAIFPREIAPPVPIAAGIIISYRPRETSAPPPPKKLQASSRGESVVGACPESYHPLAPTNPTKGDGSH